jgi:hypothetical protein
VPMQARPRKATLLPSRSLIHPASVVLSEAPIPIPLPTIPCASTKYRQNLVHVPSAV